MSDLSYRPWLEMLSHLKTGQARMEKLQSVLKVEENCECPCTFHLANQCNNKKEKADLGLFIQTNGPTLFTNQEGGCDEDIALFSLTFDRDEETSAKRFQESECEELS